MEIGLDKLHLYIHGAVRFEEKDGYYIPLRITKEQEEFFSKRGFKERARTSASQRLEFLSCGGKLSFDMCSFLGEELLDDNEPRMELYDNGICTERFSKRHVEYIIPTGEKHRITVYFNNHSSTAVKNICLPDDAQPIENRIKYLALGDSITQGFCTRINALTYANILADKINAEVLNQGVGGEIFCADSIDGNINFNPDIITVAYGTNDWDRCDGNFEETVKEYFIKLKNTYPMAKIFTLTPIYRGHEEDVHKIGTLQDVREIITRNCCGTVIDGLKIFDRTHGFYSDGNAGEAGLHPNEIGFLIYGQRLFEQIYPFCGDLFDTNTKI